MEGDVNLKLECPADQVEAKANKMLQGHDCMLHVSRNRDGQKRDIRPERSYTSYNTNCSTKLLLYIKEGSRCENKCISSRFKKMANSQEN